MAIKLAIDIGNTRCKVAVFDDKDLVAREVLPGISLSELKEFRQKFNPEYIILASVRHLPNELQSYIEVTERTFLLSHRMALPFEVKYQTPETLGLDRLAAAAGAWSLFRNQNSLVVDAGTCIKYELISQEGVYHGGNIAPGIRMRLLAMHSFTSKLPHVEPLQRHMSVGVDTTTALQVGACTGALHEVMGFIEEYKKTFGNLNILLTGGDALFFVNNLKTEIFDAPNLVLQGLNEIVDIHVQNAT